MEDTRTEQQKEKIINDSLPFIKYTAYRLAHRLPPQLSVQDLISVGIMGLLDALQRYTEGRVKLNTFVEHRIKGAMLDELRALDWVPRSVRRKITDLEKTYSALEKKLGRPATDEEAAEALGLELDHFYRLLDETKSVSFLDIEYLRQKATEESEVNIIDLFTQDDRDPFTALNLSQVREILAKAIDELPEKEKLAVALYYQEELTMKEIGEVMGYTESRISQMHSKAMLRLRAKLKKALDT
jgi:RNA polymerase sigma factor for flagellar operon FliA